MRKLLQIRRLLAVASLFAAPLTAEYESNFGRVILANCDVIAQGVASARRAKVDNLHRVDFTIEQVLYGKNPGAVVQVFFNDPATLKKDEAERGLFALKALSSGGFSLVGKPVLTPARDAQEQPKVDVCKAFIALESEPPGDARTAEFWKLLHKHIRDGVYAAENAAVELMFVARDRGAIITEELFEQTRTAVDESVRLQTKKGRDDLNLALQGMVEAKVKGLKFKKVRRADKAAERIAAIDELLSLQKKWPRAFTGADAKLCDALFDTEKDAAARGKIEDLAREIRVVEQQRKAEEERKAAEARDRVKHAGQ